MEYFWDKASGFYRNIFGFLQLPNFTHKSDFIIIAAAATIFVCKYLRMFVDEAEAWSPEFVHVSEGY